MSLTERQKEIALECWHEIARHGKGMSPEMFADLFLSRIREEQEAVATIINLDGRAFAELRNDRKYSVGTKLFTTPPAPLPSGNHSECVVSPYSSRCCEKGTKGCDVDHCDCSGLVEALKYIIEFLHERDNDPALSNTQWQIFQTAKQALANHDKRMKGEE